VTTGELLHAITESGDSEPFRPAYDLVTLLIGVNNQYRGGHWMSMNVSSKTC